MTFNPKPPKYEDKTEAKAYLAGYAAGYNEFEINNPARSHYIHYPNAYSKGYWEGKGDRNEKLSD